MADIITLLRQRDEKGLSLLYDHYASTLLGIIVRIVKRRDIGEEILQQSLLKAWDNIDKYDDKKGNLFTWLVTIARRTSIDQVRLAGHKYHASNEPIENADTTAWGEEMTYDQIDTTALIDRLDADKRAVLDMIYLKGYTQSDTAEILSIPLGTVKSRLRLAIDALRKELKEEKNLFLGMLILLTLLTLLSWI